MRQIVFYSWQSDLPNATNRGFIQSALENAAAAITSDASVAIEPVIDRDTQGIPGSPDIASTIFAKITSADVFVADISITGRDSKRSTPNPNVLIELGYALKSVGHDRVILVFNRAFGKIEELPFDLRARRVLAYDMPEEATPRGPERKNLEKQLEAAIRIALHNIPRTGDIPAVPAIPAIEAQAPNRVLILRRNLADIYRQLDAHKPKIASAGGTVDELMEALNLTQESVAVFSRIAETIAAMNDAEAALEVTRWFGSIFENYRLPQGFSGSYSYADFDYFKFLGHEMFVTFIAFFLRERRWSIVEAILSEPIPVRSGARNGGPGALDWSFASDHLVFLLDESPRRQRMSLHADLINRRHTIGGLAAIMPIDQFVEADYFLFLCGELPIPDGAGIQMHWRPWSVLYLKSTPPFLLLAEQKSLAAQLSKIFQTTTIDELRKRLQERAPTVEALFRNGLWFNPIEGDDIRRIGTK